MTTSTPSAGSPAAGKCIITGNIVAGNLSTDAKIYCNYTSKDTVPIPMSSVVSCGTTGIPVTPDLAGCYVATYAQNTGVLVDSYT